MADTKISGLTNSTTAPADTDVFPTVEDMATIPVTKRKAWSVIKAKLDTLYASISVDANIETLSADKTLIDTDKPVQSYALTAAWIVNLPAIASTNPAFYILNRSASYTITVKNASAAVVTTIVAGGKALVLSDGVNNWYEISGVALQIMESGGTRLPIGSIADGQSLIRSGATIVGGAAAAVPHGARVYNSVDIALEAAVVKMLTFDSERWDTQEIHSVVTNTSRLTCVTAGKYLIIGNVRFQDISSNLIYVHIRLNNATDIGSLQSTTRNDIIIPIDLVVSTIYDLVVGDYVELACYSEIALNIVAVSNFSPEFMMQRIG